MFPFHEWCATPSAVALLALLAGCAGLCHSGGVSAAAAVARDAGAAKTGSGIQGERIIALPGGVKKLTLDVPGTVVVRTEPNGKPHVRIRIDRNLLDLISVKASPGAAVVAASGSFRTSLELKIDVLLNGVEAIQLLGAADVELQGLNESNLVLEAAGSGTVRIPAGRVQALTLKLAGSADVSASRLNASSCTVTGSGSGSAELRCSDSISADLSGAAELVVSGRPKRRSVRHAEAAEIRFE
jgi:putative autotransporter adhesin-like protein